MARVCLIIRYFLVVLIEVERHMLDDGSVRLYNLPDTKVLKAIRGLESVSGIVFGSAESKALFVAAGHSVNSGHCQLCRWLLTYLLRCIDIPILVRIE